MESPKAWELTADYDPEQRVVTLSLWRRCVMQLTRGAEPVATCAVGMGHGYSIALRMGRRGLLDKMGLREDQVLGA